MAGPAERDAGEPGGSAGRIARQDGGGSVIEGPGVRAGEDETDREPAVLGDDTDRRGGEVGDGFSGPAWAFRGAADRAPRRLRPVRAGSGGRGRPRGSRRRRR